MNIFSLSHYGELSTLPSPISAMTSDFSHSFRPGIDINLGVGYVNDQTIPSQELLDCFSYILKHQHAFKSSLNYGAAQGSQNLIQSIISYYVRNSIGGLTAQDFLHLDVAIGANGATSILDAIADVVPKGVVFTVEPLYYIYTETLHRKGFTVCAIPETDEGIDINYLEQTIQTIDSSTISFFYIITVNNPTTCIVSNSSKQQIIRIAEQIAQKRGFKVPVFFDKAYEDIIYDTSVEKPISGLLYDTSNCVYEIGTLSKIIAPALRVGYIIGSPGNLLTAIVQRNNDVGFSASLLLQDISSVFLDLHIDSHRLKVLQGYAFKSQILQKYISEHLASYVERVQGGKAGFYMYITFLKIQTHSESEFYTYLSRKTGDAKIDGKPNALHPRLVYIPGAICMTEQSEYKELRLRQLRISFGFESSAELERAVLLMKEAAEYAQKKNPDTESGFKFHERES